MEKQILCFGIFRLFRGVPGCSGVFRGVPGCSGSVPVFRGVPVFRCSGVLVFRCSGVPGFSTCQHWSLTCPFCSIMFTWTLIFASCFDFKLHTLYIPGHQNTIANSLSRWDNDPKFQHTFFEAAHLHHNTLTEYICSLICFVLTTSSNLLFILSYFRLPSTQFTASCPSNSRLRLISSHPSKLSLRLEHLP